MRRMAKPVDRRDGDQPIAAIDQQPRVPHEDRDISAEPEASAVPFRVADGRRTQRTKGHFPSTSGLNA